MSALPYRAAFILLFSCLSLLRLFYRLKAGLFRRSPWDPEEPVLFVVVRSVLGVPLLAGVAAYCFFPDLFPWAYLSLPGWLRACGLPLGAGALALLARAHAALGESFNTGLRPRAPRLVREGPYARIRHPMYLAYCLLFWAGFLISAGWVIGAFGLAIIGLLMTLRRRSEESMLLRRFGREYLAYRQSTGAFLPRRFQPPAGATARGKTLPGARRRSP